MSELHHRASLLAACGGNGTIPRCRSEDGDLLDIFVLGNGQATLGAIIRARPIGVLDRVDGAGRDKDIIGITVDDEARVGVTDIGDLENGMREEIERCLRAYKERNGQCLTLKGGYGREEALAVIDAARERYPRPG